MYYFKKAMDTIIICSTNNKWSNTFQTFKYIKILKFNNVF